MDAVKLTMQKPTLRNSSALDDTKHASAGKHQLG